MRKASKSKEEYRQFRTKKKRLSPTGENCLNKKQKKKNNKEIVQLLIKEDFASKEISKSKKDYRQFWRKKIDYPLHGENCLKSREHNKTKKVINQTWLYKITYQSV